MGRSQHDGIEDLILNGLNAPITSMAWELRGRCHIVRKGDGTFTYKWNGVNVVASNGLVQDTHQRAIDVGDYNNDGLADIYTSVTNGGAHLYRNNGNGTFTDVATQDAVVGNNARGPEGSLTTITTAFLDIFQFTRWPVLGCRRTMATLTIGLASLPSERVHNMSAIGARFHRVHRLNETIRVIKAEAVLAGMGGTLRRILDSARRHRLTALRYLA